MKLVNRTGLQEVEAFIREKLASYQTEFSGGLVPAGSLTLYLKWTRRDSRRATGGSYRHPEMVASCRVNQAIRFPFLLRKPVGCRMDLRGRRWVCEPIYKEMLVHSYDEVMVFIAAHELGHFLQFTLQEFVRDECEAHKLGFRWLRGFRDWKKSRGR